jgi:hypothetical protein
MALHHYEMPTIINAYIWMSLQGGTYQANCSSQTLGTRILLTFNCPFPNLEAFLKDTTTSTIYFPSTLACYDFPCQI